MSGKRYASRYERMLANSEKPDDQNENGCWIRTGKTDGKRGGEYGRMNVYDPEKGKTVTVQPHREMEKVFRGEDAEPLDPDLHTIEHLCRTTKCINPDHWVLLPRDKNTAQSQKDNPRRGGWYRGS